MSLLSLDRVTAFYGPVQALFGVTLDVAEGEVVALMGRNGMGKTTTIRTICRMMPNAGGAIRFGARTLRGCRRTGRRRRGSGWCPRGGGAFRTSRWPKT
jgi:branched-chain amino acid transport system ATP-binding protein